MFFIADLRYASHSGLCKMGVIHTLDLHEFRGLVLHVGLNNFFCLLQFQWIATNERQTTWPGTLHKTQCHCGSKSFFIPASWCTRKISDFFHPWSMAVDSWNDLSYWFLKRYSNRLIDQVGLAATKLLGNTGPRESIIRKIKVKYWRGFLFSEMVWMLDCLCKRKSFEDDFEKECIHQVFIWTAILFAARYFLFASCTHR